MSQIKSASFLELFKPVPEGDLRRYDGPIFGPFEEILSVRNGLYVVFDEDSFTIPLRGGMGSHQGIACDRVWYPYWRIFTSRKQDILKNTEQRSRWQDAMWRDFHSAPAEGVEPLPSPPADRNILGSSIVGDTLSRENLRVTTLGNSQGFGSGVFYYPDYPTGRYPSGGENNG